MTAKGKGNPKYYDVSGNSLYVWLIKRNFPSIFKVTCYNCNCARAKESDHICPHKSQTLNNDWESEL